MTTVNANQINLTIALLADLNRQFTEDISKQIFGDAIGEHIYRKYIQNNSQLPIQSMDIKTMERLSEALEQMYNQAVQQLG